MKGFANISVFLVLILLIPAFTTSRELAEKPQTEEKISTIGQIKVHPICRKCPSPPPPPAVGPNTDMNHD